jgi:uncharacterized protein YjgD (DUF1641 family)
MNTEERILEQLDHLGQEVAILTDSARSLQDLKNDLSPRVNEAVKVLITELAQIESDFQLEDLMMLIKSVMRSVRNLNWTLEQLKSLIDFLRTVEPLLKSTVPQAIYHLDQLEQKGLFRVISLMFGTMQKIAETYSPEDIEQIANGLVPLVGVAKKLTAPKPLDMLSKLAEVPERVDLSQAKPVGPFGMIFALRDPDIMQGLGVVLELTKGLCVLKDGDPATVQALAASEPGDKGNQRES